MFTRKKIFNLWKQIFKKKKKQRVIFGDSIPAGLKLGKFNWWLHKGLVQWKSFLGGTSKENLYYVEPKFDVGWLHVGVTDLLYHQSQESVQNLLDNLKQIGLKCKSTGVTRILISGIVVNNKLTSNYMPSISSFLLVRKTHRPST